MRKITEIIIHCSATPESRNVTVEEIREWHKDRGFNDIGYHYVIDLDGEVHAGRSIEKPGAHCARHNTHSIGICYVGGTDAHGIPKDTRTPEQKESLRNLVYELSLKYLEATIHGHNDFSDKDCPCFSVKDENFEKSLWI